ncbi:hypothetical protein EJD97_013740 [Solanum chilense]|uniref:Berberine/berberine-like domain-containing protein n=1 Tax=Solanum chilense TaxID=4083 RepID=A0A6N2BAK1_SOLCI|nr:hypothetical protein EJD97_013740 [Solanum chilense]
MGKYFQFLPFLLVSFLIFIETIAQQEFLNCIYSHTSDNNIKKHIHFPKSPTYSYLLEYGQKNPRWLNSSSSHPIFIITPINESDIGAIIFCSKKFGIQIRVKSGGRMDEISKFEIPFPYRKGNLFNIQYMVNWYDNSENISNKKIKWDLDFGENDDEYRYSNSRVWGEKYFDGNFERLAKVKSEVDPSNFFRFEQSIPPFSVST